PLSIVIEDTLPLLPLTMLEGLVAWVLNTYLGKYVSNLNTDQLSVALLKGAVELENLPLRKDALREFDLPFEVKAGCIGKIVLQIPFYRPHSDPWVISMSQLNLIIGPARPQEYDEAREREAEREQKKRLLKALEDKWKCESEQKGESYWYSVTASVVTRIVENIELNIQGVHLRFEDDFSNPEKPFAFGVCIKNVSAQNSSKEPTQKLMRQKQLEIEEFSVYWDTQCTMLGDLPLAEIQETMTMCMQSREHQYIFEPVCASVLLRRNASKEPLRSRNTSRIEGQVQLEPLSLHLSQVQYQQIMAFLKELDRREREMLFRKWRPKVPVSKNCRQWWMFAISANLEEIREKQRRNNWDFALQRARDAQLYTKLYGQRLKGIALSLQDESELERIEEEQTLEELQILREIVHESFRKQEEIAESSREPMSEPAASSPSGSIPRSGSSGMIQYLQSWFPGWGGWYGGAERGPDGQPVTDELMAESSQWDMLAETDDLFDPMEDSQTLNTFTRRDHLFARLDFFLEKATVTLFLEDKLNRLCNESGVIQLEFSGVKIGVESLPRSESSLLSVKLGGLFLRDLTTLGSIFPVLVSPKPSKSAVTINQPFGQNSSTDKSCTGPDMESSASPVFEMIYERNPIRSRFERRLEVNTSPLNIIYNPQAIKKVADFFYKGRVHTSGFGYQSELELRVADAVRRQYNKLKIQTKAEIRQNIDQLLVGEFIENSKRWTMKLDICAPQVIFPDDFQSEDPMLVVVDLGRILLTNSQDDLKTKSKVSQSEGDEFSDEEYQTPLATPPGSPPPEPETEYKGQEKASDHCSLKSIEGAQPFSKILYEKYSLSFNDLQIMVGRYKDNWKHLQEKEVGPTHVVEKFNVLLQLEQRLRYTSDPQLPGAVLSGTLPDLKIHLNLEKMTALRSCLARLGSPSADEGNMGETIKSPEPLTLRHEKIFEKDDSQWKLQESDKNLTKSVMTLEQHTREVLVESRLLLAEFSINYMQLGVEVEGQYISVLKVFGTNAHFVKRPYDSEVSLTVHGLLLVDTLQTYGSDFDLLVASHKRLSFDVPTGSLRESQPTSPVAEDGKSPEASDLDVPFEKISPLSPFPIGQEALIKLEYQFVSSDCPSMNLESSLQVTTMQVNNLDIILNPETIVNLLRFLQKSFPKEESTWTPSTQQMTALPNEQVHEETYQSTYNQNKVLTVEIHRLNLLLLRTVSTGNAVGGEKRGMKIATASINGTKVNISMGSQLDVNGSLACIQLVDLTQEGGKSQFVVSIGNLEDGTSEECAGFPCSALMPSSEALNFQFLEKSQGECSLKLHMASLHYNHSAKFLKELSLSANEVEDNFRSMLKTAASKVSNVLATKTAEYSGMVSLFETPSKRTRSQSMCNFPLEFEDNNDPADPDREPSVDSFLVKLILNVHIESPVVSIPRKPGHPELLVGHLGSIAIQNFVTGQDSEQEKLQVEVKDIRLYSVNTSHLVLRKGPNSNQSPSHKTVFNLDELQFTRHDFFEYLSRGKAFHILKDTTIQLTLKKVPAVEVTQFSDHESYHSTGFLRVEGKFVNAVQVFLCKPVYEQLLQTLDNLSLIEDEKVIAREPPTPPPPTPSSAKPHRFPDLQGGLFPRDPSLAFSYSSVSSSLSTPLPLQDHSSSVKAPSFTQVSATFKVSELQVQLSADLSQGSQDLVSLRFQDLEGDFIKDHPHTLSIQLTLHSLLMEDLLEQNPESKHKHLMVSRGAPKASTFSSKEYLSHSCPTASSAMYPEMPRSLPAQMEEAQNVFQFYQRHPSTPASSRKSKKDSECPSTPPPSPSRNTQSPQPLTDLDDSLVHINVLLVDRRHPEFQTRYGSIGRSVDVDFNCLDVLITLQTWVVILDFFGIGSTANNHAVKVPSMSPESKPGQTLSNTSLSDSTDVFPEVNEDESVEKVNTKLDLKVHSLSLVLNKKTNELAKASVSKLFTHLEMIEGDLALQGSLGSLSLSDLTPHGDLYRERFTTQGGEALVFNILRYGEPDPFLVRECDIKVSLQMASVQYVHTQRFQTEVVAFIQHFTQLQDVLGRQRAAMEGQAVREHPQRASRVLLDIEAGAPVLLIPESSHSKRLIVANLGQLKVRNSFQPAGTRGTFSLKDKDRVKNAQPTPGKVSEDVSADSVKSSSTTASGFTLRRPQPAMRHSSDADTLPSPEDYICLLDCIAVDLQEMDLFAAERLPCEPWDSGVKRLDTDLVFPSYSVRRTGGSLLKERCHFKLKVERNLDKELSHAVPDMSIHGSLSSVHCSLDLQRYQLVRGLLEQNLGEPVEEFLRPYNLQDPSTYVGCELEEKERFWSELDEVMESIPTGERVVIGADFNGHVGEGNTGDEEVMGKFGVKERNLEGQMVVDFAKRMDMGVVNTYFQKREEHRVTYKSGGRRTQVVLPDDWETTAEVIRETGRKVLGVSSGRRKEDKETWWWNEEVQDSIQRKRLAKKKWDMDRTEENRQEYKELQCRVKREVSKAKQKAYEELYTRLDTREGEKDLYRVLTSEESVQRRWKEYFEELMNEENEREKRVEGVNSVEEKVDKIRKDEVRKALKRMKSGKAVGPDDIPVEVWKCLGEAAVEFLASLFNRVLENLEKAYDRVPREELWYCMRKSGVAEKYVRVVKDVYERSRTVVRCAVVMDQLSEEVRQESPWTMMFADDIVICSESREQVEENLERWRFALERRGMKVSRIQSNGECGKEKISVRIKGKVYRTVVRPAMLYGLETVSLRKRQESELETVLSGDVYTGLSFLVDMMNVSLELLDGPKSSGHKQSLARFDFMKSKLLFESFSDGTKSVNLVSHSLLAYDTRYCESNKATEGKHNVFDCILQPSRTGTNRASLQLELHYRSTRDSSCFTVVLNNLRVFLIFDWLLLVRDFIRMPTDKKGVAPTRQCWPSSGSDPGMTGAVMPKTVKSGVVTKRSTVPVTQDKYLEVKLNATGTEFVVVEDSSCSDTNAIILKGTTVLTYKPRLLDRPFSGSLDGIEVYSCRLGSEQDTALSIIDPVNVQVELCGSPTYQSSSGLLDAFNMADFPPLLEIQFPALDIRLSYNDVQLFLAIAKSIPTGSPSVADPAFASQIDQSTASPEITTKPKDSFRHRTEALLESQLTRLQDLGFRREDCRRALINCKGQLDQAATWLLENAESTFGRGRADSGSGSHSAPPLSGVEVKAESVCICFIDDCLDCDVPLAELTFSRLSVLQRIGSTQEGKASFTLSGDYYNRELSGWEPFIEPWPCVLNWQQQAAGRLHPSRLKLGVQAKQRLDMNITSVLLDQYSTTKTSWLADYCKEDEQSPQSSASVSWMGSSVDPPTIGQILLVYISLACVPLAHLRTRSTASLTCLEQQIHARADVKLSKRRQPFIPFALRNHTGCTMWFATLTTTPTRVALSHSSSADSISDTHGPGTDDTHNISQWREVQPGKEIPFEFEARDKLRHRHTHELKLHQLLVRVGGWEQVKPVSVDKVGVFFRYAAPDHNNPSNTVGSPISRTNIIHPHVYFSALPPVRVVFSITMEGSARKIITVQSALVVKNRLEVPMEVRLDSPSAPDKPVLLPPVLPGEALAIPLHLTSWRLQARPKGLGLFFCKVPIHWTSVERPGEINSSKRECQSADFDDQNKRSFRFCVVIKKENYPDQQPAKMVTGGAEQIYRQPGHTIYLLPTLVLTNLLPCDLNYYIKGTSIKGTMKPGKEAVHHAADTSQNIELGVLLENFPVCKELLIPSGTQNYLVRMRLYDTNKRLLCLTIRIILRAEGALKILISAPYWLLNKTGLPLIFRQDNNRTDAAGQFEEHELARSLSPLLFCYTDKEQPFMCTMRVGKGIHPDSVPGWCQGFSLDGGSGVRAVKVIQPGNRPGLIYNIGINVRKGKGRYRDTHIVTFAPRYLLDNRSSHKLAFSQREFARGKGTANPEGYISTPPGSSVVFHWPRNDYDQLLCVRLMDVPNCTWSGGFEINKPKSFHVNMRDTLGNCYFLLAEIALKGATFQISFSDTDQLPPPFRIDNISEVPIQFWQHEVPDIRLHTEVKAGAVLDYACDEPILPPYITLTVKGAGSSEVTADMNCFREYNKLHYEKFIYIAATFTFSQDASKRPGAMKRDASCAELVLDVETKTQRVILKKKEPGKRSQLWRMSEEGMLCHEGSSPPQSKPAQPRPLDCSMVLDIAGLAAVTDNSYEPLMLKRPDTRRSTTQTWHFCSGMLTCGLPRLVVQVKGGVSGLYDGAEVVLGPDSGLLEKPPEQQFMNQKLRPGSGVLSVQVVPDGPTRVLQISDLNQRRINRTSPSIEEKQNKENAPKKDTDDELEVSINLEDGVGLSLVNKVPEELVFATLSGINLHYTRTAASQVLELSMKKIQVDNQLLGTTQPVMLFVTPTVTSEGTVVDCGPALQVNAVKVPSSLMLTELFKHLMITTLRFTVIIEEKLLLKLLTFFGYGKTEGEKGRCVSEVEKVDENLYEKASDEAGPQKRYYFENLKISLPQVKLSVFTSHKLPPDLKTLKGTLGIPLVKFEDAVINMYPFTRVHPYETQEIIISDILKHFREELISQAAQVLGSVDFLGNPMGLLNDVSEGVSELIKYGNVGGLIRNVTHGVSNSAAKFAGTLSDGLGKTMDHRHQSEREYIRYHGATSGEHLVAGIHGLAHGIIGGLTSVITSTVEGVKTEGGVSGFFSGLGKGLVGTVTKPVAGALDFASETAQTVRDMASLSNHRLSVQRVRKPRCCKGSQGLLPRFSSTQADGQEQLFHLTDNIHSEYTNFIPDRSRPGLTTTAIGAVDLQGAGGNWATVGRRSRGGRRVRRQREKRKGKSVGLRIGTLNVGTMTGKGRELADVMERRKVDILCVQETRWKGSKARSIGAGFKLFYYGVDSKRNGVGVVLKEEFVRNVLEVKRVSDRVMSLKLEIEGVMLNVVSGYAPQVGCELEEKERFWSELDEVMESIPTGERVVIGADFNGHVGEGNTGDEEVMGKFGVKERNLEGQMVVDFAKRMDMGVVNTYFQKREEHRVTYKSGGRSTQVDYILCRRGNLKEISDCKVVVGESVARQHRMVVCRMTLMVCKKKRSEIEKKTKWWKLKKEECCEEFRQKLRQALGGQVVLPDDWETTAEVIRETGRKVLGVSSGRRKEDKETWWWNEEVQDSIQRKRLAKKKWDMDRTEENRQEYKELQRRVKREVSKAKQKAYDELYTRLDTREGEKDLYRLARQRDRDGKDVQQVRVIKDRDGRVLTSEESVQRRWKEYFEELMNEENEREKRVEGVNSVEQKVDKIRKDEVRKALKRMKSGKAVGPDDIPVEVWKCLGEAAVEFLASLFNRVLESERMPEEWRRSVLVPIFKNKGDVQSCSNYRGIKLMSHTMKVWERVVEARLRKVVEICEQQYGFMPRKSTTDAIFALRILMEKYRDGQRELHCVFVDLEKAYDRVPREELWYCMRKSGVAEKYVRVVQDMYERSRTVVRCAVGQTEEFNVEVGLHQGSALSPFLFAIVMDQLSEEVRQESPWTMMFADDIVICSESREQVEENLERWRFALERRGMKVSRSKTEYMCVNEREGSGTVRLQGEEVKKVQEFKYLGSTVQSNGECGKEVKKRVQAGWNGWRKLSGVLCDQKISARIKGKVYRTVVRPAMLYGLETVSLRKRQESELEVAELKMLSFIAVEPIDSYCVLISSKVVYFLKPGEYVDRESIFLEVKYDDLYHCLVSKDRGRVYVQLTKKAESTSSGVAIPGPSHQKPMVNVRSESLAVKISQEINYAKSLYYEQQLMLPPSENEDSLRLNS
ncbi:hypothetical protein QTP70_014935, partial [Hemibagrus guttatus]